MIKKALIIVFILLFAGTSVFAACDDTASTLAGLNTAIDNANPGDEICLTDGTYDDFSDQNGNAITVQVSGENGNEIIIRPETVGGVTFTGTFYMTIGATGQEAQGDFIIVKDFKFFNIDSYNPLVITTKGIYVWGDDVRITNSSFTNFSTEGNKGVGSVIRLQSEALDSEIDYNTFDSWYSTEAVYSSMNTDTHIHHNYFTNNQVGGDGNKDSAIYIGSDGFGATTNAIVEYNYFDKCIGDPETISNKGGGNIYRFNTFNEGKSLVLRGGTGNIVDSNYFFNVPLPIRIHGADHIIVNNYLEGSSIAGISIPKGGGDYQAITNLQVINNTIVDATAFHGIIIGQDWHADTTFPDDLYFKNNLISQGAGTLVTNNGRTGDFTWTTNLHWNQGSADYWAGANEPGAPGITKADPNLTQGTYIQRLQAGSANALDAGTPDEANAPDDIEENDRHAATPDIGCDEFGGTIGAPIQANEVGFNALYISNPYPISPGIPITADLTWNNPIGAVTVDVYYDQDEVSCPAAVPTKVVNAQDVETYEIPGDIGYVELNCWRVDVKPTGDLVTGIDYEFTTQGFPPSLSGIEHAVGGAPIEYAPGGAPIE